VRKSQAVTVHRRVSVSQVPHPNGLVDQVSEHEQPAPILLDHVGRNGGIGDRAGIEAVAAVVHVDRHGLHRDLDADLHGFGRIVATAVGDGVGQCFGEGGAQVEGEAAHRQRSGAALLGDQLHGVADVGEVAGHGEGELQGLPVAPAAANDEANRRRGGHGR